MTALAKADGSHALYLRGSAVVLAAGLFWSFTGLLVRFASSSDAWQYLGYRSIGAALFFYLYSRWRGRPAPLRDFLALGPLGWLAMVAVLLASLCYIFALKTTTVANTLFLSSCSPLVTAALGWFVLRERPGLVGTLAIAVGLAGVTLMLSGAGGGAASLFGNLLAFGSACMFALYNVCLRRGAGRDFGPTMYVYALVALAMCVVATLVTGRPLAPPIADIALALVNGFVFIGVGSALFIRGAAHVPAAGLAVLSQTEAIFGPLWVALVIGEVPSALAILGGVLILGAVVAMAVHGSLRLPPQGVVG
jgi:drug/metabolite transporter (DMT)-like permease